MGKRVVHLIVGLGKGGAETMLYQVLKYGTSRDGQQVISFGESHYYEEKLRELGVPVTELPLRRHPVSTVFRLANRIRGADTLVCWMYHANFFGYIVARMVRIPRIVWCIRHSTLDPALNSRLTLALNRVCARWSRRIDAIAYNGKQARTIHEAVGYAKEKGCVLDNGCDLEEYAPDSSARARLVDELKLDGAKKIILSVTKATPIKDVPTFLQAIAALFQQKSDIIAVMCGLGVEPENQMIANLCMEKRLQVGKDIFLLGMRHDVPKLMAACDLFVLHSAGEAFPNALLQAMACGCLCLTTDVGDARRILARDAYTVAPRDSETLCEGIERLLDLDEASAARMRIENRQRVQTQFDIRKIVKEYERFT